ncbi:MAG: FlgD immunoglobulin-like domain containing protein [candidate division KSB1 bacterium]|nr:FlgD immunoglobulin-like domain containing protein [candidate division KSB1 bacterium]
MLKILRIIRRHGNEQDVENQWRLQGSPNEYDNAEYVDQPSPVIINRNSLGGLRSEGALFTLGLEESVITNTHFRDELIWLGKNPYQVLTAYVTDANLEAGVPMEYGDEIAIYDNDMCVGYSQLSAVISPQNPLTITCSADDETTPDKDGFTPGHEVTVRVWDQSQQQEYIVPVVDFFKVNVDEYVNPATPNTYIFDYRQSVRIEFTMADAMYNQYIEFSKAGWHIFSLAVNPTGSHNMFDTNGSDGILNQIESNLEKVQGGPGIGSIEVLFGQWQNFIGNWQPEQGYYINVDGPCVLHVSGTRLETPLNISLNDGWNIVSYPCLGSSQDAQQFFQTLINQGVFVKALDERGNPLEELFFSGWQNKIGNVQAGEGYYVKVDGGGTFTVNCPSSTPKAVAEQTVEQMPQYFEMERMDNPYKPMAVYVTEAKVNDYDVQVGDEIAVYDGETLVGAAVVSQPVSKEQPLLIKASATDGNAPGFVQGHAMTFKLWSKAENKLLNIDAKAVQYSDPKTGESMAPALFSQMGTAVVNINTKVAQQAELPEDFALEQNYPNPFNPSTSIHYALPADNQVTVQIFDVTGKLVTTLVNTQQKAGYHTVVWNGTDRYGNQVATGIYFYHLKSGDFTQTRKMMFAK